jgi:hypothetical protein
MGEVVRDPPPRDPPSRHFILGSRLHGQKGIPNSIWALVRQMTLSSECAIEPAQLSSLVRERKKREVYDTAMNVENPIT